MRTEKLDYTLPADRIATEAVEPRDAARMMLVERARDTVAHHHVRDLPDLVGRDPGLVPGDLMVFNETRVLPARFHATRAATGGRVTGLFLAADDGRGGPERWRVMIESRGRLKPGERISLDDQAELELIERHDGGQWTALRYGPGDLMSVLERVGVTPLPPYIRRQRKRKELPESTPGDRDRYNTVFARDPGSVAAPTAGLHFTPGLLDALEARGVRRAMLTLHVGTGTFAPVRSETLDEHEMHTEWFSIPAVTLAAIAATRAAGRRIIPVGTTCVRALESLPPAAVSGADSGGNAGGDSGGDSGGEAAEPPAWAGHTDILIAPGPTGEEPFPFRYTDALFTNFHLPRSTLLALVAALPGMGIERLLRCYREAVDRGYRFYSYGDAMLII